MARVVHFSGCNHFVLFIILSIMCLTLASTTLAESTNPPVETLEENQSSDKEKDKEKEKNIQFREKFGLPAEEAHVTDVMNMDESAKNNEYGSNLTKSEYKALKERLERLEDVMPEVIDYISKNVDEESFGGLYIEQRENGKLYISYLEQENGKLPVDLIELKTLFGSDNIKFKKVKYSQKDLDITNKKIFDDYEMLKEKYNITVQDVKTDLKNNKLIVGVEQLDKDKEKVLKSLYGSKVTFEDSPVSPQPEVSSGAAIKSDRGNGCSAGFSAYKGSTYYIVTAGHCSDGYANENWYTSGGTYFGYMNYTNAHPTGNSDVGLITTTKANTSSYILGSGYYASSYSTSDGYVGQPVCINGKYNDNCGYVTSTYYSYPAAALYDLNTANYDAVEGDSGGTIRTSSVYKGIHYGDIAGSASDANKDEAYSKIGNIMSRLGIISITNN